MASSEVLDIEWDQQAGPAPVGLPAPSERELLARLRRGDSGAFESVVRLHQDRVYDFCFRMVGDREEASDLVQEIFVSVHQNVRKFREDSKLSTWIFRISKNHCLNRIKYLRRRGRGRSEELGDVSEAALADALGGAPNPDEALQAKRDREWVHRAIAELEPEQRALVALRDIEGLSYEEIVEITELAEGTVKSRLHRAREKLAGFLGKREG
ncbi:MAG TPA: sigma-70 family RNA polymerase sigma factor [Myxococcaceae bacterium]|nr:sigma-70 family RNA polymerase sigma factor [Myxococcaceae bacterium]